MTLLSLRVSVRSLRYSGVFPSLNMAVKRREQTLQDYKRLQSKVEKYEEKEKTGPVMVKLHQVGRPFPGWRWRRRRRTCRSTPLVKGRGVRGHVLFHVARIVNRAAASGERERRTQMLTGSERK